MKDQINAKQPFRMEQFVPVKAIARLAIITILIGEILVKLCDIEEANIVRLAGTSLFLFPWTIFGLFGPKTRDEMEVSRGYLMVLSVLVTVVLMWLYYWYIF